MPLFPTTSGERTTKPAAVATIVALAQRVGQPTVCPASGGPTSPVALVLCGALSSLLVRDRVRGERARSARMRSRRVPSRGEVQLELRRPAIRAGRSPATFPSLLRRARSATCPLPSRRTSTSKPFYQVLAVQARTSAWIPAGSEHRCPLDHTAALIAQLY